MTFSDVVEAIKSLSSEEKLEIQLLLQQYLREEIYQNFQAAQVEQKNSELKFSSNINELRQMIEEWNSAKM